jgi:hypothetical protein
MPRTSSQQTTNQQEQIYTWESEQATLAIIQGMTDEEVEQHFHEIMAGTVSHYGDDRQDQEQQR